jgi:hypothetical protein
MNKKPFWTLVLGMSLLGLGSGKAMASQDQALHEQGAQRPSDLQDIRVSDSRRQLAHLSKKLKLTSDQKTHVQAILSERDRQIDLIQASESFPANSKDARIGTIVVNSNELVESVLNHKQKQKFEDALARQRKRQDGNRQAAIETNLPVFSLLAAPERSSPLPV